MDSLAFRRHPLPMWVYDPATFAYLDVNDAAVAEYGLTRAEFLARTILDLRPAAERDPLVRFLTGGRRPADGRPVWTHLTRDGRELKVRVWSEPVEWAGRPARLVAIHELTGRFRAEADLLVERGRLVEALAAGGLLAWDHDLADGRTYYSCPACEYFGLPAGSLPGGWLDAVHPDDRERVGATVAAAEAAGEPFSIEFRGPPAAGRPPHFLARGRAERGSDGRPGRVLGVIKDVTDRVEAAARAATAEARLVVAQRHQAAALVVGGVAHDFNNLLTAAGGFVDLAAAALPPGPAAEHLRLAQTACGRAADLCRQLLSVVGRRPPAGPVALGPLVAETAALLRAVVPRRVGLEVCPGDGLPPVPADPGLVRQAVLNLVKNAADAVAGTGRVTVQVGRRWVPTAELAGAAVGADAAAGWYQGVRVADTGAGMPADVLGRVFDPFWTTKPDGHGLGLAVVRGAAEAHAGAVLVASQAGRGTTVELLLPEVGPQGERGA